MIRGATRPVTASLRPCEAQKAKVLLAMPQKPSTAPAAPNGRLGSIRPNLRRNALNVEKLQEENGLFFWGGKRLKHSESGRTYGRGKAAVVPFQSEHITVLVLMVFPSFCQICRGAILSRPVCTFFLVFAWVFKGFQRWSCCWQCSIAHNVSAQMNHFTSYLYHYPVI